MLNAWRARPDVLTWPAAPWSSRLCRAKGSEKRNTAGFDVAVTRPPRTASTTHTSVAAPATRKSNFVLGATCTTASCCATRTNRHVWPKIVALSSFFGKNVSVSLSYLDIRPRAGFSWPLAHINTDFMPSSEYSGCGSSHRKMDTRTSWAFANLGLCVCACDGCEKKREKSEGMRAATKDIGFLTIELIF